MFVLAQVLKVSKDEKSKTVYTIKFTEYEGELDLQESMIRDIATVGNLCYLQCLFLVFLNQSGVTGFIFSFISTPPPLIA